jgi:hypothetical protein
MRSGGCVAVHGSFLGPLVIAVLPVARKLLFKTTLVKIGTVEFRSGEVERTSRTGHR